MTWVYWEPKSRMTICSFIRNEGKFLPVCPEFGERKMGVYSGNPQAGRIFDTRQKLSPAQDDVNFSPPVVGYQKQALRLVLVLSLLPEDLRILQRLERQFPCAAFARQPIIDNLTAGGLIFGCAIPP